MPVITLNKKYLYKLLGPGFDDKKLEEQVSKLGFGVEGVDDENISLEITANRLDLLSAVGLSRTVRNFMHKAKKYTYGIDDPTPALEISVNPNVKRVRPYVSGIVAEGLALDNASLADLINFTEKFCDTYGRSRRKIAIGMHNLDAIKPPLRFLCEEDIDYVPLGGSSKMKLSQVLHMSEKGKQYSHLVKGGKKEYYPVMEDADGVAGFVPILNSERTRVSASTKRMLVEITGTSEYAVNKTADLMGATLMDMGATVKRVRIKYGRKEVYTPELEERFITMPVSRAEKEIGVPIGFDNVISLANKMGYEAALVGKNIRFRIPEYRLDIIDQQDIVEDLAIGYGYEYINPIGIYYDQRGGLEKQTKVGRTIADAMVGLGFSEFANSYLTNEDINYAKPGIENPGNAVALSEAKTSEISIMRTWILPSLLKNLGASSHEKMPQNAFEIDLVFEVKGGKVEEACHLGAISVGPRTNFNDIKATLDGLLGAIGAEFSVSEYEHRSFIPGRCARVIIGNKTLGFFGEIHPMVLRNFGIEEPAVAFEINTGMLLSE